MSLPPTDVEQLVDALYSELSGNERAARVPVRLWRSQLKEGELVVPARIPFEWAEKNLVVVVVNQDLFARRREWKACIDGLVNDARPDRDHILPLSAGANAALVSDAFVDVNHVEMRHVGDPGETERVCQAIYTSILRLFVPRLPRIFLCHAKSDGVDIATGLRRHLLEHSQLSTFFDRHDIPHAHRVTQTIAKAIGESAMLVVWTDRMLDSPWCQLEIIEARRQQRPMLILDALLNKTARLFPYLGNMPVLRWRGDPSPVANAILLELIRAYHFEAMYMSRASGESDPPTFVLHPPDIIGTRLEEARTPAPARPPESDCSEPELCVYPDPPLKPAEHEVLRQLVPHKRFLSLLEWQALQAADASHGRRNGAVDPGRDRLRSIRVGISVSASDSWANIGLSARHQDEFSFQIALQLILLGAKLVWGGDLRPEGFGSQLKWIMDTYLNPGSVPQDHVAMFVPFGQGPARILNTDALNARRTFSEVHVLGSPASLAPVESASAEGRALAALGLTAMRTVLAKECHARILLGGGMQGFQGLYPGVVEEAFERVREDRPLYIVGGFGGAARSVYDAFARPSSTAHPIVCASFGPGAPCADRDVRRAHESLIQEAGKPEWLDFNPARVVDTFAQIGVAGLAQRNGLTMEDNERLAESQDLQDILRLIVKGLLTLKSADEQSSATLR